MEDKFEDFDLKTQLVGKSFEAYVLALETINRITIQYRLESFCFLLCNAWELLLKAKIIKEEGNEECIYYKEKEGKTKRSLSLRDCLSKVFSNSNNAVRRNIMRIEELRDESVHLVITQIPSDVMSLFQAGVINYHKYAKDWFGLSLSDRYPVGMMSIIYDINPEEWDIDNPHIQRKLGPDSANFLSQYCAELRNEFDQLQRPAEFSIGIEYKLVLTKKETNADIALTQGSKDGEITHIVEVPKDPSKSHPFRQTEVVEKCIEAGLEINRYDIQAIVEVFRIRNQAEFFYQGSVSGSPAQYSQAFIDWIENRFKNDSEFFNKTRGKYSEARKSKNKS